MEEGEQKLRVVVRQISLCPRAVISLLYYPTHFLLCSSSLNQTIRLWNVKTFQCVNVLEQNEIVYQLLHWDDSVFVSCCGDGKVRSHKIIRNGKGEYSLTEEKKFSRWNRQYVVRLLKLKDSKSDLFCCLTNERNIYVISYSRNTVLTKIKKIGTVGINSKLLLSKFYINSFYFNSCSDEDNRIKLLGYNEPTKKLRVLKEFSGHARYVWALETYFTTDCPEILICGGHEGIIYFYDTTSSKRVVDSCLMKIRTKESISSFFILRNTYLFVGEARGYVEIFSLHKKERLIEEEEGEGEKVEENPSEVILHICQKVLGTTPHRKSIYDMKLMNCKKQSTKILTCSVDKEIKIMEIKNLIFDSDTESQRMMGRDLKDRVSFLVHNFRLFREKKEEEEEIEIEEENGDVLSSSDFDSFEIRLYNLRIVCFSKLLLTL